MKYRADIDGLRTIAVVPVILFHLGYEWISGGYFGVDVFFVISGFLITSILCKELKSNSFSMKEFWLRRVRRILPAVIFVVLITLIVAPLIIFRGDIDSLGADAMAFLFSYANFHLMFKFGNYWGESAESSFFLHGWSLAVEEQFYVFYPLLLIIIYKCKWRLLDFLVLLLVLSFALFIYGIANYPTGTFYMFPTRAWELLVGCLLAVVPKSQIEIQNEKGIFSSILSTVGILTILSSFFFFAGDGGINLYAILPVIGSGLIIRYSNKENLIGRILSSQLMVFIGKISFSLYLWHWPIIVLFNNYYSTKIESWEIKCYSIVLTAVLSLLSYYFIENRTRKWKYTPLLALGFILFLSSYILFLRSNLVKKYYDSTFNPVVFYGLFYDVKPKIDVISDQNIAKRRGIIAPLRDNAYSGAYKKRGIITHNINKDPSVVVLGDSHGAMWGKLIDEIAAELNFGVSFYTSVGTSPFFDVYEENSNKHKVRGFSSEQRFEYAQSLLNNLKKWSPKILIISCRWQNLKKQELTELLNLIEFVERYNTKVLVMSQPPVVNTIGDRNTAQYLTYLGYLQKNGNQYIEVFENIDASNRFLIENVSQFDNVVCFDAFSKFIRSKPSTQGSRSEVLILKNNDVLYYDDDHLSYQGTNLLRDELKACIQDLLEKKSVVKRDKL